MPAWNDLSTGDLRGLVAYLQSIAPPEPPLELAGPERQIARELYTKECAVCHGPDGKGDGSGARMLSPAPTNFHEVQPTTEYANTVLTSGVRGTAMPRWEPKLTPAQRGLLARYVRSFYGRAGE